MRKKVFSGVYACPVCEDEFELKRASGSELECPECGEPLEPAFVESSSAPEAENEVTDI